MSHEYEDENLKLTAKHPGFEHMDWSFMVYPPKRVAALYVDSQDYPPEIAKFYPNQSNFVGFVGNPESQDFFYKVITLFRETAQFPLEGLIAPTLIPAVDLSDQWSFWQMGYPAIMLTDTALYRNRHYHTHRDTIEKLNFVSITKITAALPQMFNHL